MGGELLFTKRTHQRYFLFIFWWKERESFDMLQLQEAITVNGALLLMNEALRY
jgi:hypothetical protein